MPAKDNYARNNLANHGVKVEYEKEDLPQVNHQLHEWLATVNERSSNNSIPQKSDLSTDLEKKDLADTKYDLADGGEKRSKNAGEKPSEEKRGTARKSATVVSEYAGRYAREFGLNTQASEKIAAELEAIEKALVEDGEGYFQEYRARVENIWKIIRKDGVFELVADDGVYGELSRYMFRRKFRVDCFFCIMSIKIKQNTANCPSINIQLTKP